MTNEQIPMIAKHLYQNGEPDVNQITMITIHRQYTKEKKRYKDTLKASLKDFNIPTESWEQAAQDRTKCRWLINKGASQSEAKRICKAERKRKERKARAKRPSSDLAQSEFTCSIGNRQFRAKKWLIQPSTNTQTLINAKYSGVKMVFLSNERRTIIGKRYKIRQKYLIQVT